MARALWSGAISFGLVHIPVQLFPADNSQGLGLTMVDKNDLSPVGYKRINKRTGKEVAWEDIVKAYEYEHDQYVVLSDEDLRRANAEATHTIDILSFVDAGQIPPIPESSITKPPSAELRPGQVDQDSLPPYDLLDEVLDAYVENAEGRAELLARGFDPAVVDKVLSLVDRAEWKRRQYPVGPKVTALAFGRDRRLPITTRWREP